MSAHFAKVIIQYYFIMYYLFQTINYSLQVLILIRYEFFSCKLVRHSTTNKLSCNQHTTYYIPSLSINTYISFFTGPQDDRGYFEAQVGGRVGLVPMSYVMPLPSPPSRPSPGKRSGRPHSMPATMSGLDSSPEQILAMHQQLQRSHIPNHIGTEKNDLKLQLSNQMFKHFV